MAFTPVNVSKGDQQRVARSAVELVQLRYEGWVESPADVAPEAPVVPSFGGFQIAARSEAADTSPSD